MIHHLSFSLCVLRNRTVNNQRLTSRLICELRQRLELTQEQFAVKLGVTCLTVNRWENARSYPSPMALKLIESMLRETDDLGLDLMEQFLKLTK
jgi:putative transcriptional regulator